MRTKNSLKNTLFTVAGYLVAFLLGLALRKTFLAHLDILNLGYESLFTTIFSVLFTADLGISTLITYRLYAAFAAADRDEVARLTAMYRRLNFILIGFILILGICVTPLLPWLIKDDIQNWPYVYLIYALQMLALLAAHPFDYGERVLAADQKGFEAVRIQTGLRIVAQLIKILVILVFQSYIVYLTVTIVCNFAVSVGTYLRAKKLYPDAMRGKCTMDDFRNSGFRKELQGVGVGRLLEVAYFATDSILISNMLGMRSMALYGNYTVISSNINYMFSGLLQPVASSIGNFVNTEQSGDSFRLFSMVDLICFLCASFAMACYCALFQPMIALLFGAEYLLSEWFVIFFCISHYLVIKGYGILSFRSTFGNYQEEWIWKGLAAVANIVLSILCCRKWGIMGIVLGTDVSLVLLWIGRSQLSFRHLFHMPSAGYMIKQVLRFLLACGEMLLAFYLTRSLPATILGILPRVGLCLLLSGFNLLLFCRTEAFSQILVYAKKSLAILRRKDDAGQED